MSRRSDDTQDELHLIAIARHLRDEDFLHIGASQFEVLQAAEVARRLWAPRLRIAVAGTYLLGRSLGESARELFSARTYGRDLNANRDTTFLQTYVFNDLRQGRVAFAGAMQVDQRGNGNLIGFTAGGRWVRGPGSAGLPSLTSYSPRFFFSLPRHLPTVLVPRADRISVLGDPPARRRLGLLPDALKEVITPLASFTPSEDGLQLAAVSPGVSVEEVQRQTGFELRLAAGFTERPPIRAEERAALDEVRALMTQRRPHER